jgi:hypothetical protein
MVGAPAFMRGSSAFKPGGPSRTILIQLQPRGFGIFSPTLQARWRKRESLGVKPTFQSRRYDSGQRKPGPMRMLDCRHFIPGSFGRVEQGGTAEAFVTRRGGNVTIQRSSSTQLLEPLWGTSTDVSRVVVTTGLRLKDAVIKRLLAPS